MIIEFFSNLIYTKITAFFRHLCGDGDRLAGIHPGEDCLFKGILKSDDMTTESIVAKLMWILGQTDKQDEIARLFYREINHDRV